MDKFHGSFIVLAESGAFTTTIPSHFVPICGNLELGTKFANSLPNESWSDVDRVQLRHANQQVQINPWGWFHGALNEGRSHA